LICSGFSFGDKHFKNVITEAVKNNPGLVILVTMKDFVKNENVKELVELTRSQNNIIFAGEYFEEFADNYPFASDYEHETI